METMKKVEVVVDSIHFNKVIDILEKHGVSGYTVIRDVLGKGERGMKVGDEVTDVFRNSYVFTVCPEETAKMVAESLKPILSRVGGICIISDVLWVVH